MKRLSTSLLIFILALLAMPDRAWAWSDLRLRSSIYNNWDYGYTSGTTDETSFNKVDNDVNKWTKTIDATSITEDIVFRLYTTDNGGKEVQPSVDNTDITNTGVCSSTEFVERKGSKSFRLLQSTNHYDTYTIYAEYTDKWNITVTATNSGSSDPVSKYILMKGDGTNEGSKVATFTGTDFPYTATYNIDKAGKYYFYVNDGAKNYLNQNQEITTDGGSATIYWYQDNYFGQVVKLIAPRAGEYTFKFDHVEGTRYTLQCNFPSETEKKYSVAISAGTGGSVKPYGTQQIGSTGETVTATAEEGYTFDKWTTTGGVSVASTTSATTTVTATADGKLIANFKDTRTPDPTPTPILGNNFYLVGDLFDNETSINYNTRCFKFTDNGDNTYSLDIPATLTVNAQILSVDGSTEKVYGPSTGQNGLDVTSSSPSDNGNITGNLSEGSKTLAYYWNFQNRTLASDGIYTITITLNPEGVPGSWTIKHDKTRRVAYYLSNSDGSTAQAAYAVKKADGSSDNKFFGSVFLSKGTGCYVISNITKNADTNYHSLLKTTTKFYLQGNSTGDSPVKGEDPNTKVYPVKYEGSEKGYKPFVFSSESDLQLLLEYNPSKGHDGTATQYGGIGGEVLRADYADASGVQLPEITGMKIVGPAVNNSWNLDDAVQMTYNDADNCWEAIINTSADAGEKFRFVANNTWENSWQENGKAEADKAKIPYNNVDGVGHAATTADPNEVSYIKTLTSEESRDKDYDIIFNRDHGTWRVRFYIETKSTDGGNKYNYVFKYTINGYKSVLRTYCSDRDEKPTDESIKIYGAYAFEGNETDKSGKIKLYEMNYIPANEGVILYSANVIDEATIAAYTPPAGETKYKNIPDTEDQYHNYLVGKLEDTPVNASEFDGNNVRTHRNFFFNYFSKSGCYTDGATDYLGFFRIKTGKSTCKANHAYLSLPTNVLAWNGQTFGQVMDQYETTGEVASLKNGMRIVFSDGSDWVEDVPTSITTIKDKNRVFDNYYYTLQGVRVEKPLKGIYIHNGKKVVIK